METCPALGIAVPVGKDSMSMKTVWEEGGASRSVTAPLSLIVSAFAPVRDVRASLTPQLVLDGEQTALVLIDLGAGQNRLGASALAQVHRSLGATPPDLDDPAALRGFFGAIQALNEAGEILAYHDRSDGGLFATLCEMSFASGAGLAIDLDALVPGADSGAILGALFSEELGGVIQVRESGVPGVVQTLDRFGLEGLHAVIGTPGHDDEVRIHCGGKPIFARSRCALRREWSETTWRMQSLRDDPQCAEEEHAGRCNPEERGLSVVLPFDPEDDVAAPYIASGARPRMAILREQGVNGQLEMAAAFDRAGFECVDVHMSDLLAGRVVLDDYRGLVACGGFSYGDVLGAGEGWAKSILFNARARDQFATFFARPETFTLGVCNGCQALSNLHELIPGASHWPRFVRNRSEQFEARLSLVRIEESPSILLQGMQGARIPIAVAHGEGRASFSGDTLERALETGIVAGRFVDSSGDIARRYPENPNGTPQGISALTTPDGRVTIMMPHPERVFRTVQHSWHPPEWKESGPWLRLFRNARVWVG